MIYIMTALYQEAKPILKHLELKRIPTRTGLEIYEGRIPYPGKITEKIENDGAPIRLVITGTGVIAAAAATAASLSDVRGGEQDFLINWGSCAAERGDLLEGYLANQLISTMDQKTYYPDLLFKTGWKEACVITEPGVWNQSTHHASDRVILHDMEAAAIYYAASFFLAPHQMLFAKVVTDFGMEKAEAESDAMKKKCAEMMERAYPRLETLLQSLSEFLMEESASDGWEEPEELNILYQEFCCSETMKADLRKQIHYWILAQVDYQAEMEKLRLAGELPCRDRREGKKRIEQLKKTLF